MAKKVIAYQDLPYNLQAEKAVLGSALLNKDALFNVLSLEETDFYEGKHQIIYRAIKTLSEDMKSAVDLVTLTSELMDLKELDNIGGVKYLQECCDSMVALSSLEFYIGIVKDQSTLRKLLTTIREIDNTYKTQEIDNVNDFIGECELKIKEATEERRVSTFKSMREVAEEVGRQINDAASKEGGSLPGLTSGYESIDKITQGFKKGEMTVIAARPSVGKTALALNFAFKVATKNDVPVAIFSCEMTNDSLARRLIAFACDVNLNDINKGKFNGAARQNVIDAVKLVGEARIFVDDTSNPKLADIIAKCHKLQAKYPDLGLIIIDYLGLVGTNSNAKNPDSRQEEVRKISLGLKGLAKDLQVPIIVVSQLSRDCEKRDSKRPMLSDLRDSGSIEQDADVVMLLYREDYYSSYKKDDNKKFDPGNKKMDQLNASERMQFVKQKQEDLGSQMPGDASYVEVNIAKNRNGSVGKAPLFFYKAFSKFDSPSKEWIEEINKIGYGNDD